MQTTVYQYDAEGFFLNETTSFNGLLPHGCAAEPPPELTPDGEQIPAWHKYRRLADGQFVLVEDHRGRQGYIDQQPHTIKQWGPLPAGWTEVLPPPNSDETIRRKLAEVMGGYNNAFAAIESVYPIMEREGWPIQEAEAKALALDPDAETPVLSMLVQMRGKGETVTALATKVLENAVNWRLLYAALTGQQQRMYAEVVALSEMEGTTTEEILAYQVAYRLPEELSNIERGRDWEG